SEQAGVRRGGHGVHLRHLHVLPAQVGQNTRGLGWDRVNLVRRCRDRSSSLVRQPRKYVYLIGLASFGTTACFCCCTITLPPSHPCISCVPTTSHVACVFLFLPQFESKSSARHSRPTTIFAEYGMIDGRSSDMA
ncbi:unnamed protein product, partial [Pylaiella littoralis]